MADDYNLFNNFMEELLKAINEENEREPSSFDAKAFATHLISQGGHSTDSEILDKIATESFAPILLKQLSLIGLSAFIGATLDDWFEDKVQNWKYVPTEFRKELFCEITPPIGTAFLYAGDDS